MANTIPCPNPTCTHDFSLAELQASAQLLCPKCGFRMQGKSPPAVPIAIPAQPAIPMATPLSPPPVAIVSPPLATPIATPVPPRPIAPDPAIFIPEAPAPLPPSPSDPAFVVPNFTGVAGTPFQKGDRKRRLLVRTFAVGISVCIVVAAVAFLIMQFGGPLGMFTNPEGDTFTGLLRNSKRDNEKIYKLLLPRSDWSPDTEIRSRFKAHTAWKRDGEDFWFALVVKDFGMHKPRDAEMVSDAIDTLGQFFAGDVELARAAEPIKFAALPAQKLPFAGAYRESRWLGDCYMFFNNGIGYWLFAASPDREVLDRIGSDLAGKQFVVLSERRGWREQPMPTTTYATDNGKLEITTPKDGWSAGESKGEFETGELELAGIYKKEKDGRKNASLTIFTANGPADLSAALKAAREKVEAKAKSDDDRYTIVLADDKETADGKEIDFGNRTGRMLELTLQHQDRPMRYYLLAVMKGTCAGCNAYL
jgi:hypothetical protein